MKRVYIGTSGWAYPEWKDRFYAGVPRARWLRHYAAHLGAVEVNASFYHSVGIPTLERWRDSTPGDFRFCLKANRYLTHVQRLRVERSSLALMRRQARALGAKLAVVLWQLPHGLSCDLGLLESFARRLDRWTDVRHAIEFRHDSWFSAKVADCLEAHGLATVQSHAADWPMWEAVTTDLVYLRLHGGARTYRSAYAAASLRRWARRICRWTAARRQVHVYFDNTADGYAVSNALRLASLLAD